ncbi:M16 family metallopeptidase [Mucilaginibacter sp. X5P1]|uniref:M16 family metallopeptidase n=1 Tax=Mucilaginibacter sp. X5P1 TaxID=2723088 RepID=UPI001618BA84|nr:insulinase family protein [Mucilaginibacter sp. X5P1]MBB6137273.1 zinc protease [Mucilaginibacter sp. X5P1]
MQIKNILFAALLMGGFATTQAQVLPLDPVVRTGKLPNGFTYYIRHNEEPKNRVIFYLANKVGSVLENEDQRGLAHFMEHMNFNGTKHFPHNELVNYLQKEGVRFGADINAYTSFDETVYQLPLPSDDPEVLKNGIEIMRDWAQEATLDPVEIDKERGVVLEEKRLGKGSAERMRRQFWPQLLNNSRYSVRIPIGLDTVLDNFKRPTIASFYHDWYRPDLQALIIVGDVNVDQMEQIVKAKFSDLKNPQQERVRTKYSIELTGRNQFMEVTDKEMTSTTAEIIIKHKTGPVTTEAEYREAIVKELFNNMMRARYGELSRQADPPFIQGGTGIEDFLGGLDMFDASVVAKPNELEVGLKSVWREVERVKRFGFTATELERVKESYFNNLEYMLRAKGKTNSQSYVSEYLNNFLKNEAAPGIDVEYKMVKAMLPTITLADMSKLVETYVRNDNKDILILGQDKDKATLPSETTVNEWLKAVEAENLKPYSDDVSSKPLLINNPVPGKIIKEEKNSELNITTLTLSNGIKVLLKPTDFKNDEIMFSAFSAGGTSLYSDADFRSAANAGGMIHSFGAGNYNTTELDKYLSGKQLGVQPFISDRTQGVTGVSIPKNLEIAFQLLYAYLTEPRKDELQFNNIIQRTKAGLANRGNNPNIVFRDSIAAIMSGYDIRHMPPTVAMVDQIDLNKICSIYKERFADASGMTFVFVGNIDTATIKPLLEKYIASLPSTNSHQHAKDLAIHTPKGHIEKTIYKGSEPRATVELYFTGDLDYSAQVKYQLDALKEVLEIRLLERLREDESGVYSPSAFASTDKYPTPHYTFGVGFGCAPQNVDKLIASALDEIAKLKTEGPPVVNIDKYKAEKLRTHEINIKTNEWWYGYLTDQLQDNNPLNQVNDYKANMANITQESLKETAQKYLSGKNYIKLVLMPDNKK